MWGLADEMLGPKLAEIIFGQYIYISGTYRLQQMHIALLSVDNEAFTFHPAIYCGTAFVLWNLFIWGHFHLGLSCFS